MKKLTVLQIPSFKPKYENSTQYGYKNKKGENLLNLLYQTTNGYCMYCYCNIEVDAKHFAHLEHSIEKRHCKKLEECVPNIGLACPKCNESFKKVGDKGSIFSKQTVNKFMANNCIKSDCKKECASYKNLKRSYLKKREIILQPFGVTSHRRDLRLQYNLLSLQFEPSELYAYSQQEIDFINAHIARFNLNDSYYRTRELLKFCEDIINGDRNLRTGKYNNMLVDLFIEHMKDVEFNDMRKFCETIYTIGRIKKLI